MTTVQILGLACIALGALAGWFINRTSEAKADATYWRERCEAACRAERNAEAALYDLMRSKP